MNRINRFFRDTSVAGLIALAATPGILIALTAPAHAEGKGDRADKAIAEAQGKVDMAAKLPGGGATAQMQADASAALRESREARSSGHKEEAITLAMKGSELSDRAVAEAKTVSAQRAANASADVASAQASAADANARAASAEQAANAASADAAAARAAPPVVIAQAPAPTTTEVTTTTTKAAPSVATKKRVVVRKTTARPAARVAETTTTKVTTSQN
ncbi:hypothetical protein Q4F19_14125 [Sphingomonas sp. BIUV-7]|uniref:MASP n=1 Tax=Sphingomonas natans TaxID=3063330 RepID=A0ABT8YB31_9SPHN|nr:hypothetical protein [Sphingomonas sp. BIUV-7]MDO6415524.1 hypothetical protein [Sphingomonas sp. BIUV-7]